MPLFKVTKDILERSKPITPGWHPGGLYSIKEGKTTGDASKGKESQDKVTFTFKILDGKDRDKFASRMVIQSQIEYHLDFLSFMAGKKIENPADINLTMENATKQCDIYIENREFNGVIMASVTKWRPLTKAKVA
jgi:hypothetical protein